MVAPLEALARVPASLDAAEAAPLMCAGMRRTAKRPGRHPGDRWAWPSGHAVVELLEDTQRAFETRLGQRMLSEMVAKARSYE